MDSHMDSHTDTDSHTAEKSMCKICTRVIKLVDTPTAKCKCGNMYCRKHRRPEDHTCNFDFAQAQKDLLLKTCKSCTASKLTAI